MALRYQFGGISTRNGAYFDDSERLDQFHKGDYREMDAELRRVMPKRSTRMEIRHIPVVQPVCAEAASLYIRRPTRKIGGMSTLAVRAVETALRAAKFDQMLLRAHRSAIAQNSALIETYEMGVGRVGYRIWAPYEFEVDHDDPLDLSPWTARRITLRVPMERRDGTVYYGKRIYERGEDGIIVGYDELPTDRGAVRTRELFPAGTYERMPFDVLRLTEPERGRFEPELPDDLLQMQHGVTIHASDILFHAMHGSNAWKVATGSNVRERLGKLGENPVDGLLVLEDKANGDKIDFKIHNPNPPLQKYIEAANFVYDLFRRSRHLTYIAGSGITGDAKAMERYDIDQHVESMRTLFEDFERDILSTTAMVLGQRTRSVGTQRPELVELQHNIVEPKRNALQEVQADVLRWFTGQWDPVRSVAATENVDLDRARKMFLDRQGAFLETMKKVNGPVPGMDSIAAQLGGKGGNSAPVDGA